MNDSTQPAVGHLLDTVAKLEAKGVGIVRSPWNPADILERPVTPEDGHVKENQTYEIDGVTYWAGRRPGEPLMLVRSTPVPCGIYDWCVGHGIDAGDLDSLDQLVHHSRTVTVAEYAGLQISVCRIVTGAGAVKYDLYANNDTGDTISLDQLAAHADAFESAANQIRDFIATERAAVGAVAN